MERPFSRILLTSLTALALGVVGTRVWPALRPSLPALPSSLPALPTSLPGVSPASSSAAPLTDAPPAPPASTPQASPAADAGDPRANPPCSLGRAWLLAQGPAPVPRDGRRYVTLTFDDGPRVSTTPAIVKLLDRHHARGTFFFVGKPLEGDGKRSAQLREVAKETLAHGHLVGSHTETHAALGALPRARVLSEIDDGIASVARATGQRPTLFRPPYGQLDAAAEQHLSALGQDLVMWSVEAGDTQQVDADATVARLEEQLEYGGGGIVLLHDARKDTVKITERLLAWLDARRFDPARPQRAGFVVVDLPEYERLTAEHPQPYPDRKSLEDARAKAYREGVARRPSTASRASD